MKKAFRAGALVLAILGFVAFFSIQLETQWHLSKPGSSPEQLVPSKIYRVGLTPSPWLTYKIDALRPDGSTYSGIDLYPLSGSWLVLAAAIASIWAYLKLAPAAAPATDRSSA
jgi:hypothetical protein